MKRYIGRMIDFTIERQGKRLVLFNFKYWKKEWTLTLKTGSETLALEADVREFLSELEEINERQKGGE